MSKSINQKTHFLLLNGKPVAQSSGGNILGNIFNIARSILGMGVYGDGMYQKGSGLYPEKTGGFLSFLLPILGSVAKNVISDVLTKKMAGKGMYGAGLYGAGNKKLRVEIMNKNGERVNLNKLLKYAKPELLKSMNIKGLKPLKPSQVQKLTGMGMCPKMKYCCDSESDDEKCGNGMYPSKGSGKKTLKNAIMFE